MKLCKLSIESLKDFLFDLLFPIHCLGCRQIQNASDPDKHLCRLCFEKINLRKGFECAFCSSPASQGETCPFCKKNHYLDFIWIAASYEEPLVKKMLWALKYKFIVSAKKPLGKLLIKFLKEKNKDRFFDSYRSEVVLIPLPLHRLRLNWRSYNQSELLAEELAGEFKLEIAVGVLERTKNKKPQAEIENKEERIKNTEGIFVCPRPEKIKNKTVVLVDDIATTGATLDECARILKEAGAKKVIGLVVAKG
ncbi:MAG: ComF family protein [Candidatus Yanofskybacteria bacterium]|nr:ComF family protein [Candidatus Yanofskybacteria bacterium]